MKKIYSVIIFWAFAFCILSCNSSQNKIDTNLKAVQDTVGTFYQAPEYAPMEAVWLMWPKVQHKKGFINEEVTKSIIEALAPSVKIKLIVANDSIKKVVQKIIPDSLFVKGSVELLRFNYNEFWTRDFGPAFLINNKGQKAIADFMFNDWGYSDTADAYAITDEKLDENIAAYYKYPVLSTNLITEGGNHEINGNGTMIICEAVEFDRNPSFSKQQIENEYKRLLGVKNFIWMKQGVRDDDKSTNGIIKDQKNKIFYTVLTTNGHVDEFVRFINDTTILLAKIDAKDSTSSIELESARRLEINYQILKSAKDANGHLFKIIRMPMPYLVTSTMQPGDGVYNVLSNYKYSDGTFFPKGKTINVVAAASYCNFIIANDRVLVAKYYSSGMNKKIQERDIKAQQILQSVFPDKKIIALDALAINFGGGGMHCITINEPENKK